MADTEDEIDVLENSDEINDECDDNFPRMLLLWCLHLCRYLGMLGCSPYMVRIGVYSALYFLQ